MNIFLMAVAFVVGAALGSFACCQVWRLRLRDRSKWSHCLSCGARLSWYDNIPIVSWLALRGSCRRCRAKIGCWELVSELVMGVVFAILMWWFLERWDLGVWGSMGDLVGGQAIRYWLMAICLAFLSVGLMIVLIYDARWQEMPTKVLIFCIVCAIMWVILKQWSLFAVGKFSDFFRLKQFLGNLECTFLEYRNNQCNIHKKTGCLIQKFFCRCVFFCIVIDIIIYKNKPRSAYSFQCRFHNNLRICIRGYIIE